MFSDPWALTGGHVDRNDLPGWVNTAAIDLLESELPAVGSWISLDQSNSVTLGLAGGTQFWMKCLQVSDTDFTCPVPIGLVLRLDYISRLLEREGDVPLVHIVDGDFYGDYPDFIKAKREQMPRPEPLASLISNSLLGQAFWQRLEEIDADDRNHVALLDRQIVIERMRYAILYCAFHEAAHAIREHTLVISEAPDKELARRGAELDADKRAGIWLTYYLIMDPLNRREPESPELVSDVMFNMTYSIAVALGTFDVARLAVCNFESGEYHQPTARLTMAVQGMIEVLTSYVADHNEIKRIVERSSEGASQYIARMNSFWMRSMKTTRRPTSIYFPLAVPRSKVNSVPFLSAFYAMDPDIPTVEKLQRDASTEHRVFEKLRQRVLLGRLIDEYQLPVTVVDTQSPSEIFDQLSGYFSQHPTELEELEQRANAQPSKISRAFMRELLKELRETVNN